MDWLRWINTTCKKIHLTCVVKDGIIVKYKGKFNRDLKPNDRFPNDMMAYPLYSHPILR
jgi:hypothetical protein